MWALWLLTCNSSHGSSHGGSHEHHLLSKDFILGPVLSATLCERRAVETQRG